MSQRARLVKQKIRTTRNFFLDRGELIEAQRIASQFNLATRDFHTLSFGEEFALADLARQCGYRKPRNANGSTARYFAAYVVKKAYKKA